MRLTALTVSIFIFSSTAGQDTTLNEFGGGLKRDCETDITMYLAPTSYQTEKTTDLSKYSKWDLTERYLSKDWNKTVQGNQGSCTSFAVAFDITIQRNIDNYLFSNKSELIQFSPAFIFNVAKSKYSEPFKSNCKEGISFIDAYLVVRDRGIPQLNLFNYNTSSTGCQNLDIKENVFLNAGKTKIAIFQRPARSIENFKRILVDTPFYPICVGVFINTEYENALLFNNGRWLKPGISSKIKMHAMLVVGFNDSLNAFKVMDWQGINTGDKGFIWMDYALIENQDIVFDAYICSHQTEYLDYRIGSRTSSEMNEGNDQPSSIKIEGTNADFKNDKLVFWIKSGYFTYKNLFKISCNYVSDEKNRATFRINNRYTGELIKDDIVISEGASICFEYQSTSYKLSLVEIANRGKNIFKKAAILNFERNSSCKK